MSLPAEYLERAEKVAKAQHASLNSVLVSAIAQGLPLVRTAESVDQLLEHYRKAYEGLTEEELLLVQGILVQPIGPDNP